MFKVEKRYCEQMLSRENASLSNNISDFGFGRSASFETNILEERPSMLFYCI